MHILHGHFLDDHRNRMQNRKSQKNPDQPVQQNSFNQDHHTDRVSLYSPAPEKLRNRLNSYSNDCVMIDNGSTAHNFMSWEG
jgi:hypothetical protein